MPHIALASIIVVLSNHYTRRLILEFRATGPLIDLALVTAEDPESILARGEELSLESVDQFALELIPGMSPEIAESVVEQREEVLSENTIQKGLSRVRGIGKKKAEAFSIYLKREVPAESEEAEARSDE